jgi:hypothetical protein
MRDILKMSTYFVLPVYKATYDLLLGTLPFTKDYSKEYKYTVGESPKTCTEKIKTEDAPLREDKRVAQTANKQSKLGSLGLKPNCRFDGSVAVPKSRRRLVANASSSCFVNVAVNGLAPEDKKKERAYYENLSIPFSA